MSTTSDKSTRRDAAIRNARLRLIELEIETHRVKAYLARLEARREDEAADRLQKLLPKIDFGAISPASWKRVVPTSAADLPDDRPVSSETGRRGAEGEKQRRRDSPHKKSPSIEVQAPSMSSRRRFVKSGRSLRSAPVWLISVAVHALILFAFALATFVALPSQSVPLFASPYQPPEEVNVETADVQFDPTELEELTLDETVLETGELDLSDLTLANLNPLAPAATVDVSTNFDVSSSLPNDFGTLMTGAGGGEPGGGGRRGTTSFFGTPAEGQRIMFLVDNSGSMTDGRIETTFLELVASVESLEPDQQFFVAFYSDRVYPMFYPEAVSRLVPATDENKLRLRQWLGTVELCTGGQLVEAIELAIELRPQVVFLLSDGAITGRKANEFMSAETNWPFTLHTLGMNVKTREDAQRLIDFAAARGGMFRMVRANAAAIQMSQQRPIRHNSRGATWKPTIERQ